MTDAPEQSSNNVETGSSGWTWAMGGALAAGLIVGGSVWLMSNRTRQTYREAFAAQAKQIEETNKTLGMALIKAKIEIDALRSQVELFSLEGKEKSRGKIIFDAEEKKYILIASSLPPLAAGKSYQFWLIDKGGPVPAGTFGIDGDGAAVQLAIPKRQITPTSFAVTIENEGGAETPSTAVILQTKEPTTQP